MSSASQKQRRTTALAALSWLLALSVVPAHAAAEPTGADVIPVTAAVAGQVIDGALRHLQAAYVYPEVAARMAAAVRARQRSGAYDGLRTAQALCQQLTADLRAVSRDRHLRILYSDRPLAEDRGAAPERPAERAEHLARSRHMNFGFERVERLPGNIGYLDLRFFDAPDLAGATAAAAMSLLGNSDAIIIDLRRNIGGEPDMVALLTSYLFDGEPVHLNDIYWRPDDSTRQYWTLPYVPGPRLAGRDVYVLTSRDTFSGGEEFANNLKVLRRATLVGETTGGGAHPVEMRRITDHFGVVVPAGRALNPVTKSNWEGVGVKPDVEVPAAQALLHAQVLALKKAVDRAAEDAPREKLRQALAAAQRDLDALRGGKG